MLTGKGRSKCCEKHLPILSPSKIELYCKLQRKLHRLPPPLPAHYNIVARRENEHVKISRRILEIARESLCPHCFRTKSEDRCQNKQRVCSLLRQQTWNNRPVWPTLDAWMGIYYPFCRTLFALSVVWNYGEPLFLNNFQTFPWIFFLHGNQ